MAAFVASSDQPISINSRETLVLDNYYGRPTSQLEPKTRSLAVITINKLRTDSEFRSLTSGTSAQAHLRKELVQIPDMECYIIALHLSLPVLLYLNHALATRLGDFRDLLEQEAPQLEQEIDDYLPGTITGWTESVAGLMQNFGSALRETFHFTLLRNGDGSEQLTIKADSTEPVKGDKLSLPDSLIDSPRSSAPAQDDSVLLLLHDRSQIFLDIIPPPPPIILSTTASSQHLPRAATGGLPKRNLFRRFFAPCCRHCGAVRMALAEEDPVNSLELPLHRQSSVTVSIDKDAAIVGSRLEPTSSFRENDAVARADELLEIIRLIVETLSVRESKPLIILDFTVPAEETQGELSTAEKSDMGAVLRRGESWNGAVDDGVVIRLISATIRQMNAYCMAAIQAAMPQILWSRRNMLEQLLTRRREEIVIAPRTLVRGDHLFRRIRDSGALGLMTHHGIYVGEGNVIHYSGNESALNTLILPDHKATKLKHVSLLNFLSGQSELKVRQYVRSRCEHGFWNVCPQRCAGHRLLPWPGGEASGEAIGEENDWAALVFRRRHMLSTDHRSKEPWYVYGDCYENVARRAEYAYALFHRNRREAEDAGSLGGEELEQSGAETDVGSSGSADTEGPQQMSVNADNSAFPVLYQFPAYNLFRSNCEHFASWCVTGWGFSLQVSGLTTTLQGALQGFHSKK